MSESFTPPTGWLHGDGDLVRGTLLQGRLDGLRGTLAVGLQNDGELLAGSALQLLEDVVEGDLLLRQIPLPLGLNPLLGGRLGGTEILDDVELVAGVRKRVDAGHRHGRRRHRIGVAFAPIVHDVANPTEAAAHHDAVALGQSPLLHETRDDGTTAVLHPGFEHRAFGGSAEVGTEVQQLGLVVEHLEQIRDADVLDRAGADDFGVAAPFDRVEFVFRELTEDSLDVRVGGLALSTLFKAMTMGTPAALAWLIDSTVWGMTPSSAATTSTTMSVTWAPRARILNAS